MASVEGIKNEVAKTNMQRIEDLMVASFAKLGKTLPDHITPERFSQIILSQIKMIPKLQDCSPITVITAVAQMASLGLEPLDGQAYIIPYNNRKKVNENGQERWHTVKEAQFQIGFKGYVTLFYRHEAGAALYWGTVHENDTFNFNKGENVLTHTWDLKKPRGEAYAYWVKAKLKNGTEVFEIMSKLEVEAHAKEHSKTFDTKSNRFYDDTPWATDFDSMAKKTVLIQLMKLLPKSVEIQRALTFDNTIKTKVDADMMNVPDETTWDKDQAIPTSSTEPEKKD